MSYLDNELRNRVILEFINTHGRAPTSSEIDYLYREAQKTYPSLNDTGFSRVDIVEPGFHQEASRTDENTNRKAKVDDLLNLNKEITELSWLLEASNRSFNANISRVSKDLDALESRADTLLLQNSSTDQFVWSVEETFSDQLKVVETDCLIDSGRVMIGSNTIEAVDPVNFKLSYTVTGNSVIGVQNQGVLDNLKQIDGSTWQVSVRTRDIQPIILQLDILLDKVTDIGSVALALNPVSLNSTSFISLLSSKDQKTFSVRIDRVPVINGENRFKVNLKNQKALRVLIHKSKPDEVYSTYNLYHFEFDFLQIGKAQGPIEENSIVCGPYTIRDSSKNLIYPSKATLNYCGYKPEGTNIDFYLGQDGDTWIPIDLMNLNVVSFARGDKAGTYSLIDAGLDETEITQSQIEGLSLNQNSEAFINLVIDSAFTDLVNQRTITVKRNLPGTTVRGLVSGWEELENEYSCTVYVDAPEGQKINLGASSAFLNERLVTGEVVVQNGYSTFRTSDANWREISTFTDLEDLKRQDSLYPFNHKLLIEGLNYPNSWIAERVYEGLDSNFGMYLRFVPPEIFDLTKDLKIYTIYTHDSKLYFKVYIDKSISDWDNELFEIDYTVQKNTESDIYFKAVLKTDTGVSPILDSVQIRVV